MQPGSLRKPYPHNSSPTHALTHAALFGFFVFLFLTIFQPFGIRGMPGPFLGVTAGFGAVTAGVDGAAERPRPATAPCPL